MFSRCRLLETVALPGSVHSIGNSVFSCCPSLTSVVIPDSVTSIGDYAFMGCTGLPSIEVPDSVTRIGQGVFNGCTGLTTILIPDSVTSIGDNAFMFCQGLTSATIPDGVTCIGSYAFNCCLGLTSVTLPDSVTSIGEHAFAYCNISDVTTKTNLASEACYPTDEPLIDTLKSKVATMRGLIIQSCLDMEGISEHLLVIRPILREIPSSITNTLGIGIAIRKSVYTFLLCMERWGRVWRATAFDDENSEEIGPMQGSDLVFCVYNFTELGECTYSLSAGNSLNCIGTKSLGRHGIEF